MILEFQWNRGLAGGLVWSRHGRAAIAGRENMELNLRNQFVPHILQNLKYFGEPNALYKVYDQCQVRLPGASICRSP